MKYPILHTGVTLDGRIIVSRGDGTGKLINDGAAPEEMVARGKRARTLAGGPWVPVPGVNENAVVGNLSNGDKVRADWVGWAYNDAMLLDEICGAGTYERVMPAEELEILAIARRLYAGRAA